MTDSKTKFTATFTLSQEGEDGEIVSKLEFSPLVSDEDVANNRQPDCYDIMSYLVQQYLYIANIVDEDGDIIDHDAFDNTSFQVRQFVDKSTLN